MMLAYGGIHQSETPQKAQDPRPSFLISHQNSQKYLLPSIASTRASDVAGDSNKLGLIRYNGRNREAEFASQLSVPVDGGRQQENHINDSLVVNPLRAKYASRPMSIQRSLAQPPVAYEPPMSRGLSKRNEQSSLDHIRRIRRNLPSSQNMRPLAEDVVNLPAKHLEAAGVNLDHYKRIKQEEAQARAKLLAARQENMLRYRPSNNAMAAYSPLRNDVSRQSHQSSAAIGQYSRDAVISKDDLSSLRQII